MRSLIHANRTFFALSANALLLLLILITITMRDGRALAGSPAFGQTPPPQNPAAANGLTAMPCQLAPNTWGCYVMDSINQTLSVYQCSGRDELRLLAARDIQYDRKLGLYNTSPSPIEIKTMLGRAEEPSRAAPTTMRSPEVRYR